MEIQDQSELRTVLDPVKIPRMFRVRQVFPQDGIPDGAAVLGQKLAASGLSERISPGMRIVITGSSRQIDQMPALLGTIADFVRAQGAQPYLIPAMGSHGGGTAEGQREILASLGITEEACRCPIHSSMETTLAGHIDDGSPVYVDAFAHAADGVIVVGRIKAHTAFRGPYESGLIKMMAIGMGKRAGADALHAAGYRHMGERLPKYARVVSDSCHILFGVAAIENESDRLCRLEVLPAEEIFDREPQLLRYAKSRMPRIRFPETDLLVVREIGKNFSGAGMDPNVTGTFGSPYASGGIRKQRVTVLDISEESHGNFIGLGNADTTTKRVFEKLDTSAAYLNAITDTMLSVAKIPMVLESDRLAIQAAIRSLVDVDKDAVRIVFIRNSNAIGELLVSEAFWEEAEQTEGIEILGRPEELTFDSRGNLF